MILKVGDVAEQRGWLTDKELVFTGKYYMYPKGYLRRCRRTQVDLSKNSWTGVRV